MNLAVNFACVGVGGALGACCRYSMSLLLAGMGVRLPLATLSVNLAGALLAGILVVLLLNREMVPGALHLILVVGFLGGFTTFSAFSVETMRLFQTGDTTTAFMNIVLNVIGSLLSVFLGAYLASRFLVD